MATWSAWASARPPASPSSSSNPARRAAGIGPMAVGHRVGPLGVGDQGHQIGLEEVPVVVGLLLRAQGHRATGVLVPVAGLLHDLVARLDHPDLAVGLVVHRPARASGPS